MTTTASTGTTTTASTLLPPRLVLPPGHQNKPGDVLECSVHTLPKPLLREFRHVFADQYLLNVPPADVAVVDHPEHGGGSTRSEESGASNSRELLAIPTNQRSRQDLVAVGDHIEEEKDRLLNVFIDFARELCEKIRSRGYWADFIDPCSGLPMMTLGCNKVYSEVDSMECLLNYKSYNAGFCKILTHPKWGSSVYPATIFCHAPSALVIQFVNEYPTLGQTLD